MKKRFWFAALSVYVVSLAGCGSLAKFLEYICKTVNDFERTDEKDETFWRDFLFFAYTGLWEDEAEIVKVPRVDLGFDEPVVKVRLEEAQAYARLVFGEELPDLKPAFEEMKERQTSFVSGL